MANASPATVRITAADINGNSIAKDYTAVRGIDYDFFGNRIRIEDATGVFYFGYSSVATVTQTITNGITAIVIS